MPRTARNAPGGLVYHVLNRAVARRALFKKDDDYEAFERVIAEALQKQPIRVLGYCVLHDHWRLVLSACSVTEDRFYVLDVPNFTAIRIYGMFKRSTGNWVVS